MFHFQGLILAATGKLQSFLARVLQIFFTYIFTQTMLLNIKLQTLYLHLGIQTKLSWLDLKMINFYEFQTEYHFIFKWKSFDNEPLTKFQ